MPESCNSIHTIQGILNEELLKEKQWLDHVMLHLGIEQIEEGDIIAWSTYHTSQEHCPETAQPALIQLMPLFF